MRYLTRMPQDKRPIAPLWIGWVQIVRILFRRRLPQRFTDGVYRFGPQGLKRAYIWVGCAQNPNNFLEKD